MSPCPPGAESSPTRSIIPSRRSRTSPSPFISTIRRRRKPAIPARAPPPTTCTAIRSAPPTCPTPSTSSTGTRSRRSMLPAALQAPASSLRSATPSPTATAPPPTATTAGPTFSLRASSTPQQRATSVSQSGHRRQSSAHRRPRPQRSGALRPRCACPGRRSLGHRL